MDTGVLDLSYTGLEEIPTHIPPHIEELRLDHNSLTSLDFPYRPTLQRIYLHANHLLSDSFPAMWPPSLKILTLNNNSIYSLDDWPPFPEGLLELDLSETCITNLRGDELPKSLKKLCIDFAGVEYFNETPPNLTYLSAVRGNLKILPWLSPDLQVLILASNHLSLPALPRLWPNSLRVLDIANNGLSEIPVGLPSTLETLILDHNQISIVPKGRVPASIVCLNLRKNRIYRWDLTSDDLSVCLFVNLSENRLVTAPSLKINTDIHLAGNHIGEATGNLS
jgi:Leucine-rich repeat (LRR) protein